MKLPRMKPGRTTCLKCLKEFSSADVCRYRRCAPCSKEMRRADVENRGDCGSDDYFASAQRPSTGMRIKDGGQP